MKHIRYPFISKILFPQAIKSFPAQAGKLFFTFDDGPNTHTTPILLNILKKYNCKATFFCLGENALKNPELVQAILNDGHSIGNHGFSHLNGFKISTTTFLENINKANELLQTSLFRPPYGKMTLSQYLEAVKIYKIILWDVMSYDFDANTSTDKCISIIKKHAKDGSIIVFHDNEKAISRTVAVLPAIIEHYINKGCLLQTLPTTF